MHTCGKRGSFKTPKSNHDQDEENSPEAEALLSQNEDKKPLHHGAKPGKSKSDLSYSTEVSFKSDRNDERKDDEMSVVVEHEDAEGKIISPMTVKDIVYRIESTQCIPQTSSAMTEEGRKDKEKIKRINVPLKPARSEKGMEGTEERKEKESSEAESETISNDDIKAKLTHKRTEDMDERKETNNEKANFEMEEKDITEIKLGTEDKKDTRQKQDLIQETMVAKVEQKDKLETNSEVENAQELEAEAMGEQTPDTRAETVQTSEEKENGSNENDDYETTSDADRSRNAEGAVDVDMLDGARSTGQNLVYTDLSLPEHSQDAAIKRLQDARRGLNPHTQ
ncbi:hypothetical protein C0Q70_14525 [Pomacea canaliculata]|uniref:Uncharacterized protein n=1 Tax=Pomacea canaliculata TaxID=400727 RepID=A0A2T7NSA6_POMCA|nr:stress response protein NST1-like [Pomacea canaliculata]PVD24055.1 hypothetical protein C0Q70_14525 [Pomacea canaliculata]